MPESAEDLILRVCRRRINEDLALNHPDELIREVAMEVLKGTYSWTEAAASGVYGPAVEAMGEGDGGGDPSRDVVAEAEETFRGMVAAVIARGEAGLAG